MLEGSEPVRALRAALAGGPEAWLVGGVVRDAYLGRPLVDLDLAVAGDPEQAARRVARALGGPAFSLSEAFGSWRALDRERRFEVDVSALQGDTIEEDLARRDFTVNAMAVPLAGGDTAGSPRRPRRPGRGRPAGAGRTGLRRRPAAAAAAGAPGGRAGLRPRPGDRAPDGRGRAAA